MAMFVLVVDTSLMNVSISAVVQDIGTTVSGVQSAIALEALVSAAFILIGSKVGDLFGRKRAYVMGLLGYMIGAIAMTVAQSLTTIIIFWAIIGGLGASLLLPSMQSLIHGNFEGAAQRKVYALVGASAAIAAAVGPLLGGFITTYLSWRVAFGSGSARDRGRAHQRQARARRALHRLSCHRSRRRGPLGARHGRRRARDPRVAGRRRVGRDPDRRRGSRDGRVRHVARASQAGREADADRSGPLQVEAVPPRHLGSADAADRARWPDDRAADLPADGARVQRDGGRPFVGAAVTQHVRSGVVGREEGGEVPAEQHHPRGLRVRDGRRGADPSRSCPGRIPVGGWSCR